MKLENFCEIKAIDEARAMKIIRWYKKTRFDVSMGAGNGMCLDGLSLIKLLTIFGNSKNIEKDFGQLIFGLFEEEDKEYEEMHLVKEPRKE